MINGHTNTQYWNKKAHPEYVQVKLFSQAHYCLSSQTNSHKCHRHRSQSKIIKRSFRSTHRKQYDNHITYTATYIMKCFSFSTEFLIRIWCQWMELWAFSIATVFQSVRSQEPQRHQMKMWRTTHTITLIRTSCTGRNMYVWFINLELWEKHEMCPCTQMHFKHYEHALRIKDLGKVKKEIKTLSAARKWDLNPINSGVFLFVCFKPL